MNVRIGPSPDPHGLRRSTRTFVLCLGLLSALSASGSAMAAEAQPRFSLRVEAGPVWQSLNDVQIPNDPSATRFSLVDVVGRGPQPNGRTYLSWNINESHGLRALFAPLTISERGVLTDTVRFAGETFLADGPVDATYRFNSWRLSYRYQWVDRPDLRFWIGFSAKIRDAKVELQQGETTGRKTDLGFVPLLHLAAAWTPAERWTVNWDFDGLAGGPGRAFDVALTLGYDVTSAFSVDAGYRTIEGGADVDSVYSFAWLHYAVVAGNWRF